MRQLLAGMSPGLGVSQVPRLRAETHFGVQARALPVGLHNLDASFHFKKVKADFNTNALNKLSSPPPLPFPIDGEGWVESKRI